MPLPGQANDHSNLAPGASQKAGSAAEEREMEEAERIGRSKSRGEGASPDADAADAENQRDLEK